MNMQKVGGVAWPSLFVVITGIYVYWASQGELVSSRPPGLGQYDVPNPSPDPGMRTIWARLWEDPYSTAYRHWKSVDHKQPDEKSATISDPDYDRIRAAAGEYERCDAAADDAVAATKQRRMMRAYFQNLVDRNATLCLPVFLPGGPYAEDVETRMRIRYAVTTSLAEAGYFPKRSRSMSYFVAEVYVRVLRGWQKIEMILPVELYRPGSGADPQVLVMWIDEESLGLRPLLAMHRILNEIFGEVHEAENLHVKIIGPASSDRLELMQLETSMMRPSRIEQLAATITETAARLQQNEARDDIDEAAWRIKRKAATLRNATDPPSMVQTLIGIRRDVEVLTTRCAEIATGDDGQAIADQIKNATEGIEATVNHLEQWNWVSYDTPLQPIDDYAPLWSPKSGDGPRPTVEIYSARATADVSFPEHAVFKLFRVVGTDLQLAESLRDELELRGALHGDVVLITEHDTVYGRRITTTFASVLKETHRSAERPGSSPGSSTDAHLPKFVSYRVLRGIDGKLPEDKADEPRSRKDQTAKDASAPPAIAERPPQGRSQYDYLRRLGHHIATTHGHVAAIGVVGTDVYDKLLALRALKPQFPDTLFFTTDLEAIYAHPEEIQHTRNLVVASHFGLTLNKDLQQKTPPFRESYQTATFLATRLAVRAAGEEAHAEDSDQASENGSSDGAGSSNGETEGGWDRICKLCLAQPDGKWLEPLVHVVGRDDVYQLTFFQQADPSPTGKPAAASGLPSDSDAVKGGNSKERTAAIVHPTVPNGGSGWHYGFVVTISLLIGGCVWGLLNRDRVGPFFGAADGGLGPNGPAGGQGDGGGKGDNPPRGPTAGGGTGEPATAGTAPGRHPSWFSAVKTPAWVRQVRFGVVGPVAAGALLLLLSIWCWVGETPTALFAGYSTWPGSILHAATGMLAVCALGCLADGFRAKHNEGRERFPNPEDAPIAEDAAGGQGSAATQHGENVAGEQGAHGEQVDDHERAKNIVFMVHGTPRARLLKAAVVGLAAIHTGVLFVYEFESVAALTSLFVSVLALGALWSWSKFWRIETDASDAPGVRQNWILGNNPLPLIYCAMVVVGVVTLFAWWGQGLLERSHSGWHPIWIARGSTARSFDWLTTAYAAGTVGLLVASLLFCHVWCREFARVAERANTNVYDRLWFIDKLTSVSSSLVPWLMGLLLMMVLAYHPVISPTPMPMGMLALLTVVLVAFVASSLLLRRNFQQQREDAVNELDESPPPPPPAPPQPAALVSLRPVDVPVEAGAPVSAGQLEVAVKPETATAEPTTSRQRRKQQLETLSDGVFKPWSKSPIGWLLGGGTLLALADWWVRWWIIGL